ncbi:hypothetical protein [Oryza sativa Japonica Group]|uniref:Uncharacterized protein n=1 Tax=Oryza sativa subsp. japonica TaxID=39947 RepID=Q5JKP7_ORYSJ|nr:hypothetical protein [Oryza sativa Japonica Group]
MFVPLAASHTVDISPRVTHQCGDIPSRMKPSHPSFSTARPLQPPKPPPLLVADLGCRHRLLSRRLGLGWDMWCGDETDWVWFDLT